jgi:hypothetical protein
MEKMRGDRERVFWKRKTIKCSKKKTKCSREKIGSSREIPFKRTEFCCVSLYIFVKIRIMSKHIYKIYVFGILFVTQKLST